MPYREPSLKFREFAGYETHQALLKRIVERNNGALMLFYGPPGTGKSIFAEALAGEYGYNLIFISGSELESKWVGESKDRLATVYERAKQLRPCIITFDEIDTFIETRGMSTHQKEQSGYM
jgi:SpoVK/Ycf46/Vps4 family AAA+-type ATPase